MSPRTKVAKTVGLHESTVKNAQELMATSRKRTKPRPKQQRPRSSPVEVEQTHPAVMAEAKRIVRQTPGTRVRAISADTAMVENIPPK